MAKKDEEQVKCYHCGEIIEMFNDIVEKRIALHIGSGVRYKRRQFHFKCLSEFLSKSEDMELREKEQSDWDELYQYVRKEIFKLNMSKPLNNHTVMRLRGLRVGKYKPNGNNVMILKRGYDYKTILIAFKVVKAKILSYASRTTFVDEKHFTDAIMKFVTGEINDIYKRLESQEKVKKKLEQDAKIEIFDYTEGLQRKERKRKIRNDIDD